MSQDEFLLFIKDSKIIFEKSPTPAHFSAPTLPNFEFSCLQHKTVIIYMLFNNLGK